MYNVDLRFNNNRGLESGCCQEGLFEGMLRMSGAIGPIGMLFSVAWQVKLD